MAVVSCTGHACCRTRKEALRLNLYRCANDPEVEPRAGNREGHNEVRAGGPKSSAQPQDPQASVSNVEAGLSPLLTSSSSGLWDQHQACYSSSDGANPALADAGHLAP